MSAEDLPDVLGLVVPLAVQRLTEAGWRVREIRAVPPTAGEESRGRVVRVRPVGEDSVSVAYVVPPPAVE